MELLSLWIDSYYQMRNGCGQVFGFSSTADFNMIVCEAFNINVLEKFLNLILSFCHNNLETTSRVFFWF